MPARLKHYITLVRLDRPIGILLLLWPTLWALWIASEGRPDTTILVVFVVGTILMRSAGCAVNDVADQDFDAHVKRTADRPLAAKKISITEALALAGVLALIAFLLVVVFLNRQTLYLAFIALFLAVSYPFTKRFFAMPQAYLGIAFGFGIPMAFAAETGAVPALAWWLLTANVFWTLAYDTEYAMVDRDDDVRIGIKTTAILFGKLDVAMVMLCYLIMLMILTGVGKVAGFGWPYFVGLMFGGGIALFHYTLIRKRDRDQCFKAFLHNNWLGFAVFCGLMFDYALRS